MLQKAIQGEFPGRPPYGYKRNKGVKEIFVVPQEAEFVKKAFELYSDGFRSIDAVRDTLYKEGYQYKQNQPKIYRGMLGKLLKNIFYTGDFMFNGVFYKGKHPAIISKELFNDAQKALKESHKD